MGRGRQKAKQTKVARDLKYYSPPTDLSALERELASARAADGDEDYSRYAEKYATVDDDDEWNDER